MFAILLIIITVCEVFAAIVMFITAAGFEPVVRDVFKLARDGGDGSALARSFVNDVQMNLRCCGTYDASFWHKLPSSCCYNGNTCNSLHAYGEGCTFKIMWYAEKLGNALGAISITIALLGVCICLRSCSEVGS
ncbi:uncharacterized protein LOC117648355 [Thrips palmi]|uniref:Uncharacterized protein LOC117648355 n=1 Tax=Thrips palmi TaxID=161013 RepID=A0A6P8ZCT5_THRPL|nr:uncharacterized protein LOC117648355 [Thrips palmi]